MYFGFTNCPDICPAEMDKIGEVVSVLGYPYVSPFIRFLTQVICAEKTHGAIFQPLFISVDPARDTLPKIRRYLADFHPSFIGATAPSPTTVNPSLDPSAEPAYLALKSVCKVYRVYFSTPPEADPHGDYLVDHSIFIYLMDPKGEFVEAFGQAKTTTEIVERMQSAIEAWERENGNKT